METNETTVNQEEPVMELDQDARYYLYETSKWSYFMSILGFIGIGFMILVGLIMSFGMSFMNNTPMAEGFVFGFMWIFYLGIAVLYFFPIYYLFKFSVKVKAAIRNRDNYELTESFRFMKKHYKFIGILSIVMLILYPLIMIFGAFGGFFSALG